jgi:hypothetical protein
MPKRILQGVVVSDKNDKTVVVRVERRLRHPVLKKTVRLSKKYHAHDEKNEAKVRRYRPYRGDASALEAEALGSRREGRRGSGNLTRTAGPSRLPRVNG